MKQTIKLGMCAAIAVLSLSSQITLAQFNPGGPILDKYARTDDANPNQTIRRGGMGRFIYPDAPKAIFDINSNLLTPLISTAPNYFEQGEVFRTDCPASTAVDFLTAWRMFNDGTARGMIFNWGFNPVVADRNNFSIQATGGDMTFHTGTLNAQGIANERMRILFGNGFLGIGTANPQNLLHLNDPGAFTPVYTQWTNGLTGVGPNNGLKIGINTAFTPTPAEIRYQQDSPIDFYTNTQAIPKVRIWNDAQDRPRVGIGLAAGFTPAATYLHLGDNYQVPGYRTWMDIGTLYSAETDNMYTGLRRVGLDQQDAIINWGNNPIDPAFPQNTDRLRFVFTAVLPGTIPKASSFDGLEIARMTATFDNTTNNIFSRTGIGDFFSPVTLPLTNDPQNALEIRANTDAAGNIIDPSPSGLRFSHLTSASTPVPNVGNMGVLAVNATGDVIYVPDAGVASQILSCSNPGSILTTTDGRVGLNGNNFYFEGNGSGNSLDNSVIIGRNCSLFPFAKLDVFQNSASQNTIGINVENRDASSGTVANPVPVIGIKSTVTNVGINFWNVAGWFEAPPAPKSQFALFVPGTTTFTATGGTVDIGFTYTTANPDFILDVNGQARINGTIIPSDSTLKTNVMPFNSGLSVIRDINPMFYHYNGKGGFETQHQYIGVMAQELASVAPYAVDSSFQKLDSADSSPTAILNVYNEAIIYTSLNAIKQLDSAVTAIQNNPGVAGAGTTNYLTKWQNANTVTSSSVFDDGSNVGIGTTNPQQTLDVIGSLKVGSGVNLPTLNNGYGIFTSVPGVNAGFTINRGGNSSYASLDFVESGLVYTTGWSVQMAPYSEDLVMLDRTNNINIITLHHGGNMDVVGNIYATGTITQNSDAALKQNIDSINNALGIIAQLKPHTFNFDTTNYSYLNLPNGKQYGITAQEAETVLPEIVKQSFIPQMNDSAGNMVHPAANFKTVNYTALIPILLKAVKEQQQTIQSLQSAVGSLQSIVSECCSTNAKTTNTLPSTDEELSSASAILYQNIPNPFGDGTVIRYFVPSTSTSALILFYDEFGNSIKTVELSHKGQLAELNLSTTNLAAGIYSYSLLVNGKIMDTKKMLRVK